MPALHPTLVLVLLAMALLLPIAGPARAQDTPAPGDIVINEILYDPGTSDEFVELFNRADDKTFDLSQFEFSDSRRNRVPVTNTQALLAPGEYAVLVRDGGAFESTFPDVSFIEPPSWPQLNNSGDTVVLYFGGEVIDEVSYPGGLDGISLERIDPFGPSDSETNFAPSDDPRGATPGEENSRFMPDTEPPTLDDVTVAEDGASLTATFSEPLDPASVSAGKFTLRPDDAPAITAATLSDDDPSQVQLTLQSALPLGNYTLVVQDVRDLRGNVLQQAERAFSFFRPDVPTPRDVVINEIDYAPPETEGEFVELFNRADDKTFDLSQFTLADARNQPVPITDAPTPLRPGEYAVLVRDAQAFQDRFPNVEFIEVANWPALNNTGDRPTLLFSGTEIDAVPYEPSWGGSGDASLERIDPDGPSTSAANFGSSTAPQGGTPGAQNSLFDPDEEPPRPVFAEQTAPAVAEVFFNEPLDPASVEPDDFALDDGRSPTQVTLIGGGTGVRLTFDAPLSGQEITVRDVRDITGNTLDEAIVNLAFTPEPGELVINEIMYDPLADDADGRPDQPEYFELSNRTERALKLEGLFWTDIPDENGEADTLRLDAARKAVAPGGYAVVHATPDDASLTEAFPEIDFSAPEITRVPLERAALGLINSGDLIFLHRADGTGLDSVRYDPDWHLPGIRDASGVALERIDPDGPSNAPSNWTSSAAEAGGTPGLPNAATLPPGQPPAEAGITVEPSPFSPDGDGLDDVTAIRYTLDEPASLARIRIYDSYGREVYADEAELVGRTGQVFWDGFGEDGQRLRIGIYVVLFEALDGRGGTIETFKEPVVLARPLG